MTASDRKAVDPRKSRKRWLSPLVVALGLLPTMGAVWNAYAGEPDQDAPSPMEVRKKILARIPDDPSVLINVTDREIPSSPDILNLGKRSTKALEKCLSDNVDAGIRQMCAILLGNLGDRRALPTLQAALEDWEAPVRRSVVYALYRMPDRASYEPLMKLLGRKDEDPDIRSSILRTLGALSDPRAVQVLRKELRHKPSAASSDAEDAGAPDLRPSAFHALWRSRHLMAQGTLIGDVSYALGSDNVELQLAAIEAASELRAPQLVGALIPLMDRPQSRVRNRAVYALGLIGDKAATKALLGLVPRVRESRILNNIAFALERLDRDAFFVAIRQLIEHKQAMIRLNAAFVVGDVRQPEGLPLLRKALEDPNDLVKTSALVAMGKLGLAEAIPLLEKYVDSPNLAMRQEAIYAIYRASGGKRAELIYDKLFSSSHPLVKRRAAIELGKAGDTRARDYLLSCLESSLCPLEDLNSYLHKDKDTSVPGRLLLAWAKGRSDLTDIVSDLRPAGAVSLAVSDVDASMSQGRVSRAKNSIDLVGDLGDPSVKGKLQPGLAATDTWLRVHAEVALARLGETAAEAALIAEFDNLAGVWMPGFSSALSKIEEAPVRGRLAPELIKREAGADVDVAMSAASVRLAWDPENAFFRFLAALASPHARERDLAESYIKRDRSSKVTALLRRALSRESRPATRDRLRKLLDARETT
jgi:HEAT repeat protein